MSDPVFTFVLIACYFAALAAARWFKTLDSDFVRAAATPSATGVACGLVILWLNDYLDRPLRAALIGVLMTFGAVYIRHVGDESEPIDGMLLGAIAGGAAAIPLAFSGSNEPRLFAQCVSAASIAGFGITFAALHVADRARQRMLDCVTGAVAIVSAFVIPSKRPIAIVIAAIVPVIAIATVFKQWRSVRAELSHEASLGFMDDADVRVAAHPLLRLGSGGWSDAAAHREFVKLENKIALRKRQQRTRPDDTARLYQLEIIKLRMQAQEMSKIGRIARSDEG